MAEDLVGYMEYVGYWTPFESTWITDDPSITQDGTPIYTGVCYPTGEPTTDPTAEPTDNSTVVSYTAPNFVYLVADDLGYNDVSWRESTNIYTPRLEQLTNKAVELMRFYVTPKCSPTRTAFFTGRYTHKLGMQHNVGLTETSTCGMEPGMGVSGTTFWSERLKSCQGYKNYYLGKWHMVCFLRLFFLFMNTSIFERRLFCIIRANINMHILQYFVVDSIISKDI